MKKVLYYAKRFGYNYLPDFYFKNRYKYLEKVRHSFDQHEINNRINYYLKFSHNFNVPDRAISVQNFKRKNGTEYYLDLKEYLHYFAPNTQFTYRFGDDTSESPIPIITKARKIKESNNNSILFKLDKKRHFKWVDDPYSFSEKGNMAVWRGGAYQEWRKTLVQNCWNNPMCNIGQTNKPKEDVPWQKGFLPIQEQLKYKFILCPEGNDVATNLKWAMSSNSLCVMPKPRFETWFMEGTLIPGVHYVEVTNDYSDLEEKMEYYLSNINESESIIQNAHNHVQRFQNQDMEDLLCLKVLERYTVLSQQHNVLRFGE